MENNRLNGTGLLDPNELINLSGVHDPEEKKLWEEELSKEKKLKE